MKTPETLNDMNNVPTEANTEMPDHQAANIMLQGELPDDPTMADSTTKGKSEFTLTQLLIQLKNQKFIAYRMMQQVEAQIIGIKRITEAAAADGYSIDVSTLVGIAADLIEPYQELLEDIDNTLYALEKRLFVNPEHSRMLPEASWLALIDTISTERGAYSNEDMWALSKIATAFKAYADNSPEVSSALSCLEKFAERQGACIYTHHQSGSQAFSWMPGQAPHERRQRAPLN